MSNYPIKGQAGYSAAIDRKASSKAPTCRTMKFATRDEAVAACLAAIDFKRVRVKPGDTITTTEWQATGDGGWQIELMQINGSAETVTIEQARAAQAARDCAIRFI